MLFFARVLCIGDALGGSTVTQVLQTLGVYPMEPVPSVRFMRQMAYAVSYIHSRGILRRDLYAGNIMVQPHGGAAEAHICVTDFGMAEILEHPRQHVVQYNVAVHAEL